MEGQIHHGDLLSSIDKNGVATLTLNRSDKHNAFDAELIQQLISELERLSNAANVRCLLLRGNGKHFSAGADLNWMRSMAQQDQQHNVDDAAQLAHLMKLLDSFPHPTIVYVHGCAFGGALGLICCCDIALADIEASFCLSEVKLGLVPATIAPYVCRTIGARLARRYMLTAEPFDAEQAQQMGVVHHLTTTNTAEATLSKFVGLVLANSPAAMSSAKELIHHCSEQPINAKLIDYTSELIAQVRVSEQGQEGLNAFLEKRTPVWQKGHPDNG